LFGLVALTNDVIFIVVDDVVVVADDDDDDDDDAAPPVIVAVPFDRFSISRASLYKMTPKMTVNVPKPLRNVTGL
jgi:hypothetical protein